MVDDRPVTWGLWSEWSECNDSCVDYGEFRATQRSRQRQCYDGYAICWNGKIFPHEWYNTIHSMRAHL